MPFLLGEGCLFWLSELDRFWGETVSKKKKRILLGLYLIGAIDVWRIKRKPGESFLEVAMVRLHLTWSHELLDVSKIMFEFDCRKKNTSNKLLSGYLTLLEKKCTCEKIKYTSDWTGRGRLFWNVFSLPEKKKSNSVEMVETKYEKYSLCSYFEFWK